MSIKKERLLQVKAFGNRLLVERLPENTSSRIIIPIADRARYKSRTGKIISAGQHTGLKVGQVVVFERNVGIDFVYGYRDHPEAEYCIIKKENVLAVVEDLK